jgi:hypothetical protein
MGVGNLEELIDDDHAIVSSATGPRSSAFRSITSKSPPPLAGSWVARALALRIRSIFLMTMLLSQVLPALSTTSRSCLSLIKISSSRVPVLKNTGTRLEEIFINERHDRDVVLRAGST